MAASGLNPKHRPSLGGSNEDAVCEIVEFAIAMRQKLKEVNMDAFNTFQLRVGIASGPLISGVIGARKPIFDIWGNTGTLIKLLFITNFTCKFSSQCRFSNGLDR